jgi:uncharacterized membrane protein YhaH (DUF805 family)
MEMHGFRISPRGVLYFCIFVVAFAAAIKAGGGSGTGNLIWTVLIWSFVLLGSLVLLARLWASRHDADASGRAIAKGAYGLLPPWLRLAVLVSVTARMK